jgi:hypothetical protein
LTSLVSALLIADGPTLGAWAPTRLRKHPRSTLVVNSGRVFLERTDRLFVIVTRATNETHPIDSG